MTRRTDELSPAGVHAQRRADYIRLAEVSARLGQLARSLTEWPVQPCETRDYDRAFAAVEVARDATAAAMARVLSLVVSADPKVPVEWDTPFDVDAAVACDPRA